MAQSRDTIAAAFGKRAANYDSNSWHIRYAERLVGQRASPMIFGNEPLLSRRLVTEDLWPGQRKRQRKESVR
jgi:hypothetical protein